MSRRTTSTVAVIATILAGAFASTASADMLPATLGRAVQIADAAWPASPCRGHLKFASDSGRFVQLKLNGTSWVAFAPIGGDPSKTNGCLITMDPSYFANVLSSEVCDNIVHEAGHLDGQNHTLTGVMAPHPQHYAGCDRPLTIRERITDDLYRRHGGLTDQAVFVRCGRWRGRVLPCRVELASHAVRYRARVRGHQYAISRSGGAALR